MGKKRVLPFFSEPIHCHGCSTLETIRVEGFSFGEKIKKSHSILPPRSQLPAVLTSVSHCEDWLSHTGFKFFHLSET